MKKFLQTILSVLKGGTNAFMRYPGSMTCALTVAVSFVLSIHLNDYGSAMQKALSALELAFVFGAFLNMALTAFVQKQNAGRIAFWVMNSAGIAAAFLVYLAIYYPKYEVSAFSTARVLVVSLISLISFILVISAGNKRYDFNQSLFMTMKSFFIALIYSLVILGGLELIAGAVKALLYTNLSDKIYQYIAVFSLLAGYAFFLGHFPKFTKDEDAEKIEKSIRYPRFIEILLQYILIPIIGLLSAVLLIWVIKIPINGKWPDFNQLTSILTSYSLLGILLYILVSPLKSDMEKWYRKLFPFTALLFMAFEAYAVIRQISMFSFKVTEYGLILIWLFTVASLIIFILTPAVKNRLTAYAGIILLAVSVLPLVGYVDLPVSIQTARLQNVLLKDNMLVNGKIIPNADIVLTDKEIITDSVSYIVSEKDGKLPAWFERSAALDSEFYPIFGFHQTYAAGTPPGGTTPGTGFSSANLNLGTGAISISGYAYFVVFDSFSQLNNLEINGKNGKYLLTYSKTTSSTVTSVPVVTVQKNGTVILNKDMREYFDSLFIKYKSMSNSKQIPTYPVEDMSCTIENNGIKLLLVFNHIYITQNSADAELSYDSELKGIYFAD